MTTSSARDWRGNMRFPLAAAQKRYVFDCSAFGGLSKRLFFKYMYISLCISIYIETDISSIPPSTIHYQPSTITIYHPGLPWHQCPCGRDGVGGQDGCRIYSYIYTVKPPRGSRNRLLMLMLKVVVWKPIGPKLAANGFDWIQGGRLEFKCIRIWFNLTSSWAHDGTLFALNCIPTWK